MRRNARHVKSSVADTMVAMAQIISQVHAEMHGGKVREISVAGGKRERGADHRAGARAK